MTDTDKSALKLAKKIQNGELTRLQVLSYDLSIIKKAYDRLAKWKTLEVEEV